MKTTLVQPYLFFGGRCEEAITFYRTALRPQVEMLMGFKESPEPPPSGMMPASWGDKSMHASLSIGGNAVMASDGCGGSESPNFSGCSLSLNVPDGAEARRAFTALADDGTVEMPLAKTFWPSCFGTVTDLFGVGWMVIVEA